MDERQARKDYRAFKALYPGVKNPTDINKKCKYDFAFDIGWERFSNMQQARKRGCEFTKL